MIRHQRDAVETAYRTAMAKIAYSGEGDEREVAARAYYDRLMADEAADEIDEEIAGKYRKKRAIGTLAALASVPAIGLGLYSGVKVGHPAAPYIALGGAGLGTLGLIGRGVNDGKLKRYYGDRDFRRYKNVGNRIADTNDALNLAAYEILKRERKASKNG